MSYFELLKNMAKLRLGTPPTAKTTVPLGLSQGAAVDISDVPVILATGTLVKPVPTHQSVVAVGEFDMFGHRYLNSYLSGNHASFIQALDGTTAARLFVPYAEVIPGNEDEWAWWLNRIRKYDPDLEYQDGDVVIRDGRYLRYLGEEQWVEGGDEFEGYIGKPIATGRDEDGTIPYRRVWGSGDWPIDPVSYSEVIDDGHGSRQTARHRAMLYARLLEGEDGQNEYLLVSAVDTGSEASVNLWLGLDMHYGDLKVFPG